MQALYKTVDAIRYVHIYNRHHCALAMFIFKPVQPVQIKPKDSRSRGEENSDHGQPDATASDCSDAPVLSVKNSRK